MSLLETLVRLYFRSHAGMDVNPAELMHFVALGMGKDPADPQIPLIGAIRMLLNHGQTAGWVTITSREPLRYQGTPPEDDKDIYPGDPLQDQIEMVRKMNEALGN